MPVDLPTLRQIQVFSELPDEYLARVQTESYTCLVEAGETIISQGEADRPVFFVLRGNVRVYRTHTTGRGQTLIQMGPGQGFNIPTTFASDTSAPASVLATEDTVLLSFDRKRFVELTVSNPPISRAVLQDLSNKMRHFINLAHDLSMKGVSARIAGVLVKQCHQDCTPPVLNWTHEEIALQVGSAREVVSRTLKRFQQNGWVRLDRSRIEILDIDSLSRFY